MSFQYRDQYIIGGQIWPLREVLEAFIQHYHHAAQYGEVQLIILPDDQLAIRREVGHGIQLSVPFGEFIKDFLDGKKYDY